MGRATADGGGVAPHNAGDAAVGGPRGGDRPFAARERAAAHKQQAFANFVQSVSESFWIQAPSPLFLIEAHCDIAFWWFTPTQFRRKMIRKWHHTEHRFLAEQMASTRPISGDQLGRLFPSSRLITERLFGFPKSQIVYARPTLRARQPSLSMLDS